MSNKKIFIFNICFVYGGKMLLFKILLLLVIVLKFLAAPSLIYEKEKTSEIILNSYLFNISTSIYKKSHFGGFVSVILGKTIIK